VVIIYCENKTKTIYFIKRYLYKSDFCYGKVDRDGDFSIKEIVNTVAECPGLTGDRKVGAYRDDLQNNLTYYPLPVSQKVDREGTAGVGHIMTTIVASLRPGKPGLLSDRDQFHQGKVKPVVECSGLTGDKPEKYPPL
jgi:hypothetical protein